MEPLGNRDPPHTFLGRPVVVWVVGRLNLAGIFVNVPSTGSFRKSAGERGSEEGGRPLVTTRWLHAPTFSSASNKDCLRKAQMHLFQLWIFSYKENNQMEPSLGIRFAWEIAPTVDARDTLPEVLI